MHRISCSLSSPLLSVVYGVQLRSFETTANANRDTSACRQRQAAAEEQDCATDTDPLLLINRRCTPSQSTVPGETGSE